MTSHIEDVSERENAVCGIHLHSGNFRWPLAGLKRRHRCHRCNEYIEALEQSVDLHPKVRNRAQCSSVFMTGDLPATAQDLLYSLCKQASVFCQQVAILDVSVGTEYFPETVGEIVSEDYFRLFNVGS